MLKAILKQARNFFGHSAAVAQKPLQRMGSTLRYGLSEQELDDYAESKLNHLRFVKDQLLFEGEAQVPVDSLEWIVPGLNKVWRSKDRLVFYRVSRGVTIKVVRPEDLDTSDNAIECCVFSAAPPNALR